MKLNFDDIFSAVPKSPGLYEIYTNQGIPLKVGIAADLRTRLRQHARSSQRGLKLKRTISKPKPSDVISKQSILAKHLYFDRTITNSYNLRSEEGRQNFLAECCYVTIKPTSTKEAARTIEIELEATGRYRYVGKVVRR